MSEIHRWPKYWRGWGGWKMLPMRVRYALRNLRKRSASCGAAQDRARGEVGR